VPIAVVSRRRRDFTSWDQMSLPLPFTRGRVIVGTPIFVAHDADPATQEAKRMQLEGELNRIHLQAYTQTGRPHPAFSNAGTGQARP